MDATAQRLVDRLGMTPLPVEATCFVSTYRSEANTATGGPVGTVATGPNSSCVPTRPVWSRQELPDALIRSRYRVTTEEGTMPSKSPQKPSAKKAGKTLKEKREAKREKKEKRPPLG